LGRLVSLSLQYCLPNSQTPAGRAMRVDGGTSLALLLLLLAVEVEDEEEDEKEVEVEVEVDKLLDDVAESVLV
jgi:hypothetical protein